MDMLETGPFSASLIPPSTPAAGTSSPWKDAGRTGEKGFRARLVVIAMLTLLSMSTWGCATTRKTALLETLGEGEYSRLMELSLDDFDQSSAGFRPYSGDYELVRALIPEYIQVNRLSSAQSRNLHWHLGQIHAFNGDYKSAIAEMKQSYEGGSISWASYVRGSIAFLERDKTALQDALNTLAEQENQMNLEILENFVKYFGRSYSEAYNAPR
jgi:hypothetical protein